MRITGGNFRGRALVPPRDAKVRPTSDKVRQAIFNLLDHAPALAGFSLAGARVVDFFAGTGALGLEALSRGASYCLFVDDSPESRALIRENVEAFGLTGASKIWRRNAALPGRLDTLAPFGVAFLDPPYRQALIEPALKGLAAGDWLQQNAIAVVESNESEILDPVADYEMLDRRVYGDTAVMLLRFNGGQTTAQYRSI
jgi:16S rRNA (guanine966-N2)-methyltransferase